MSPHLAARGTRAFLLPGTPARAPSRGRELPHSHTGPSSPKPSLATPECRFTPVLRDQEPSEGEDEMASVPPYRRCRPTKYWSDLRSSPPPWPQGATWTPVLGVARLTSV